MWAKGTSPVSFVVDPQRDGISNALWKEVESTIAVSGGKFRFNAAEGLVRADLKYGRYEFAIMFPLTGVQTPTNLVDDIEFGLKNLSLGNIGKIQLLLDKSAGTISFNTYSDLSEIEVTTIQYDTDWNEEQVRFVIEWFNDRVRLTVISPVTGFFRILADHKSGVGSHPLNPYVKVVGAENLDVGYIVVDNAHQNSIMLI